VNFNVNFNILLKQICGASVGKIKDFDNIKMHDTTVKTILLVIIS